jgi:quinol monooxygenase YgiN
MKGLWHDSHPVNPGGLGVDGFVILARFKVTAGQMPAFLDYLARNAAASVADEPGCRRFDVLTAEAGGDEVVLYEIYDSPAAFEAHLQTPHFAAFATSTKPIVLHSSVERLNLREHVKPR